MRPRHPGSTAWKGQAVSRRHVREFRPDEALSLIIADRDRQPLRCPSCGSDAIQRVPARCREEDGPQGRIQLCCGGCTRLVSYTDRLEQSAGMR